MTSFDWESFRKLSEALVEAPNTSAKYRSAVSRAYYSIFNHVKQAFDKDTTKPRKICDARGKPVQGGSHKKLIVYYQTKGGDLMNFATSLDSLKEERVAADYKATEVFDEHRSKSAIALADRLSTDLESLVQKRLIQP